MLDSDQAEPSFMALRNQAIDRTVVLLRRLRADQADLMQRSAAGDPFESGAHSVQRAVQAAERVYKQLQGG